MVHGWPSLWSSWGQQIEHFKASRIFLQINGRFSSVCLERLSPGGHRRPRIWRVFAPFRHPIVEYHGGYHRRSDMCSRARWDSVRNLLGVRSAVCLPDSLTLLL